MKTLRLLVGVILIFWSSFTFAADDQMLRFRVLPEESFITYTVAVSPDIPPIEERFDITGGYFDVLIYTGRCSTRYIRFESSDITTTPATLPYGSFNLPSGVTGEFDTTTFYASDWGWCQSVFCDSYDLGGTTSCMPGSLFSEILGSLDGNEITISGVMDIESSWTNYHFSIKAIMEPTPSDFPWSLFMPTITGARQHKEQ